MVATGDAVQIAASASTALKACAAASEYGRDHRDWSAVADAGELAARVMPVAEKAVADSKLPRTLGALKEAELHLATARAHQNRLKGRNSVDEWGELAARWALVPIPYHVAKARWWQAAAALESRAARDLAREALNDAARIARELPARPLRRALNELAARGRIGLADETGRVAIPIEQPAPLQVPAIDEATVSGTTPLMADAAGEAQSATGRAIAERLATDSAPITPARFGLSPRESEVLLVLAEGRTNREIAERLYISERTVAVHVRRILAKLGVAGRVEATGLAIRLGAGTGRPNDQPLPDGRRATLTADLGQNWHMNTSPPTNLARVASVIAVAALATIIVACAASAQPGWTYMPLPPSTPPASGSGSPGASGTAAASGTPAVSGTPAASGTPGASGSATGNVIELEETNALQIVQNGQQVTTH